MAKSAFVDTNIFIRYFTKDDAQKAKAVRLLFKDAATGKHSLITSIWVLAEIEFILRRHYNLEKKNLLTFLKSIFTVEGLAIAQEDWAELTLELFEKHNIDFVDCLNAAFVLRENIATVYSYDNHFDRIPKIKRIEPTMVK